MTAIYQGTHCMVRGRHVSFSLRFVFQCPCCEYVMTALTEEGAVTLAYTHSVTAGHSVFLEDLCSDRVGEGFVEMVRSVARKVAAP